MDPRDDDDDFAPDESEETEPRIRELQTEMIRLQAQIDQLHAATAERSVELTELRARIDELERKFEDLKKKQRLTERLRLWIGLTYGASAGMLISMLLRL